MADPPAGRPLPVAAMTELDGVVAVYAARTDQVLVLSETASEVWRLLDGVRTERDVAEVLAQRYGASPDVVATDVSGVVATFASHGLLEQADGGPDLPDDPGTPGGPVAGAPAAP